MPSSSVAILFFISGHGFGHASREVEVINALAARRPDLRVIVRTDASPSLLARTLRTTVDLRPGRCDSGIVQRDSVTHDDAATIEVTIAFYDDFEARVAAETRAVAADDVRLVVGDIPPIAFAVAARLGVPSLAIANFTWDWIYDGMPPLVARAPWLGPRIRDAYAQATLALALPFTGGFNVFPRVQPIPLIARRAQRDRADTRARFDLPSSGRVALLSFGGYGLPSLDLSTLDCVDDWTIVTTDRTTVGARHDVRGVVCVDETSFAGTGYRYEDLVAAADVVITKPGYGIIAECAANGTAMLYTSRGDFREYDVLVREMPAMIRSGFIAHEDLFAGRWRDRLDALMTAPVPPRPRVDGAEVAAGVISEMIG